MSDVTVTPTVEAGNWPPRIRLDVSDANIPAYLETTVVRLHPDGRTVPVRTPDGGPLQLTTSGSFQVGTLYDYEAPYGLAVSYTTEESPAIVSAQVTLDIQQLWLIHVGVPELSRPITVAEFGARTRRVQRGVFYPMGRATPVVHTDGARKADEYSLTIYTASDSERWALDALLSDTGTLFLNVPVSRGFGVGAEYVSVGDVQENRAVRFAGEPSRLLELAVTVVDRPAGGTQADRTWADVISAYASWADVRAAYATWQDVLSGP